VTKGILDNRSEMELPSSRMATPGFIWTAFLFLLFTGPPKFRVRSPDAAAYGELDPGTVMQLIVWITIGLFTFYQFIAKRERRNTTGLHWVSFLVIGTMGISTFTSLSPSLTAFKTIQVVIAFLFCWLFIQLFGVDRFLHVIMWGCLFLCTAVVVMWFFDPDSVVLIESTGEARLRGQAIYEVAHPALFGLVLLLSGVHTLGKGLQWFAVLLFGSALLLSLDRMDWLAFAVTVALAAYLKPDIPGRRLARVSVCLSPVVAMVLLSFLSGRRELDSMFADSERWGLWAFLVANTLATSPWIGTGFIAGSRLTGMEYTIPLPSGHSIFIDAFSGCGLLGLAALLVLVFVLLPKTMRLVSRSKNKVSFAVGGLVFCLLMVSLVGAEIEATPFGVLFWGLVSAVAFSVDDKSPSVSVNRMPLAVKAT
jgi:hypothetical protein